MEYDRGKKVADEIEALLFAHIDADNETLLAALKLLVERAQKTI